MVDGCATEQELALRPDERPRIPGLVLVSHAGAPICRAIDVREPVVLGREGVFVLDDPRASRRHAEIVARDGIFHVRDLGSSNGTFVDGRLVRDEASATARVLRVGSSLLLFEPDLARFWEDGREDLRDGGYVLGPALRRVRDAVVDAAQNDKTLLVTGESGSGKERVAAWYHHQGPRARAPFKELNCATLSKELAASQLFGAERGAHSGAHAATTGLLRDAHRGVLFLDEVAELALDVQAKLLRAIETKTVVPLGATTPRPADVAFVSATNADVDAAIAAGRFRHDLRPRLAQREVHVPPLRARLEEIPFLIEVERARIPGCPPASARFVEACLERRWELNVRELFIAVDRAAATARASGAKELAPEQLPPPTHASVAPPPSAFELAPVSLDAERRVRILAALEANRFSVPAAARALGIGRSTLYDAMKRFGIRPR